MKALCVKQLSIFDEGRLYEYTRITLSGQYTYGAPITVLMDPPTLTVVKIPAHEFIVTRKLRYDSFRLMVNDYFSNEIDFIDKLKNATGLNIITIMPRIKGYILKAKFEDHEFHAHFRRFL